MSHDVLQIVKTMDQRDLNLQLALQCAPLLTGIKISNLLIVNKANKESVIEMFQDTALSYYVFYESEQKVTFYLYEEAAVSSYLQETTVREAMKQLGCEASELETILQDISVKYQSYMKSEGAFPHELGLLLGYPAEDVVGFIVNEGKNYLYTGYWKVYANVHETVHLFEQFKQAKEKVIRMVAKGISIHHILESYYLNQYIEQIAI